MVQRARAKRKRQRKQAAEGGGSAPKRGGAAGRGSSVGDRICSVRCLSGGWEWAPKGMLPWWRCRWATWRAWGSRPRASPCSCPCPCPCA